MTEFSLVYTIRNFAALETTCGPPKENEQPFDSWSSDYIGELFSSDFTDNRTPLSKGTYDGSISISMTDIESTPVIVGIDAVTKLQPQESGGHVGLPTVHLRVDVDIKNLPTSLHNGLSLLIEEANKSKPAQLIEELRKHPEWLDDPQIRESPSYKLWRNRIDRMEDLREQFEPLAKSLEELGLPMKGIRQLSPEEALTLLPAIPGLEETSPQTSRGLIAQYLEIFKGFAEKDPEIEFNQQEVEEFGCDFFEIFRNTMNGLLRYFKYNLGQYWLNEIEPGVALFYVQTEVEMEGRAPLIPLARHKNEIQLLNPIFVLPKEEWPSIKKDMQSTSSSMDGALPIGRIFTQAEIAMTEEHLEAAIIIAHVALEASLNRVLEYFYENRTPNVVLGKKLGFTKCLMRKSYLSEDSVPLAERWRLVEGKPKSGRKNPRKPWDYEDGLLPIRNNLQHRTLFPEIGARRVAEYISAARWIARHIERWLRSSPSKLLAKDCSGHLG